MKSYKSKIILKYGTDLIVSRFGEEERKTKALLGRGSRNNTNMKRLESQKEGIFLPDFDVRGGDFVINPNHNEMYVVSGAHKEYDGNFTLSVVVNLLKCNGSITVKENKRVADSRGNLKTVFEDKYTDLPVFLQEVTNELRQYEPGIHPDTEYRLYTTSIEIAEVDQVLVTVLGRTENMKVISKDYTTFPHMVVLEVNRDIRK